jgi:hypothetical protein
MKLNQDDRKRVGHLIELAGEYYQRPVNREITSAMLDGLDKFGFTASEIESAFARYRATTERHFMPTVSELAKLITRRPVEAHP